jgi:hypothetical protein
MVKPKRSNVYAPSKLTGAVLEFLRASGSIAGSLTEWHLLQPARETRVEVLDGQFGMEAHGVGEIFNR